MATNADDIAAGFTKAISFPEVVLQLDEMLKDEVSGRDDFARLISRDPGLTATLLRIANSAMYGFSGRVSTVDRAIALVGMREIRDLVLSVTMKTSFDQIPNDIQTMNDFWRHSLCCALACRRISETANYLHKDAMFTAGLIHDIGHLAMFSQMPEACTRILLLTQYRMDDVETYELERELIGFDHHQVGAIIARAWRFPELLQDTIRYHHVPDEAPQHQLESSIVHLGNTVATLIELERKNHRRTLKVSPVALQLLGLDEQQLQSMSIEIETDLCEMCPIFGIAA